MNPWDAPDIEMTSMESLAPAYVLTLGSSWEQAYRAGRAFKDENFSAAEVSLAATLRECRMLGFRQQEPFGPYSADFYWPDVGLVVEVDGAAYHQDQERERQRDTYLLEHGAVCVMHIQARRVFSDIRSCVADIGKYIVAKRELVRIAREGVS